MQALECTSNRGDAGLVQEMMVIEEVVDTKDSSWCEGPWG